MACDLIKDFFNEAVFEDIDKALVWENHDGAPRDECFMSTRKDPYTYGQGLGERTYHPIPFSDKIEEIRKVIRETYETDYQACFSNKYVDKTKHLGWHADDSESIDHSVGIAVVSFGAEREIWYRENGTKGVEGITKVALPHGSLFFMPPGFQQTHQHRIPKHSAECEPRISLTFRKLL
jgi:alkylated DNA repair dioxygenase AlkB